MAKKTLYKIFAFGVSVITITAVLILSVFYSYSDNQLKEQLRVVESVVENQLAQDDDTSFISNHIDKNVRITLVAKDGTVIADSQESANKLGNHLNRQEIQQAIKNGEATVTRHSDTQGKKIYYFAKQLDNGNILRVSTEAKSIGKFFSDYIIYILLCIIVVIVTAVFVSMGITKSIVKPITQLGQSLDNIDKFKSDEELKPLVNALLQQKKKQKMLDKQKKQFTANVSHELKTPLTSIINYVDLIKKEKPENEKIKEYIGVLDRQSVRLKKLIEDLVEASKASTGNLTVNLAECEAGVLLSQTVGEFDERLRDAGLTPVLNMPEEPIKIMADGRRLWRVFENLMSNICKYSLSGTRAYMELYQSDGKAFIVFKNISKCELNISSDELTERFVRGDTSRNTEGSGLGLSIAKSLTELQKGEMRIETDGDLFKATLIFDAI